MKEAKTTAITKIYDLAKPAEAVEMAIVLKEMVVKQRLSANIKGKNYAMVEAWQLAGFLTGTSVMVEEPKNLSNDKEIKYSCAAKIYQGDKMVGVGYALCSSKEMIKKGFEEYAILSMAQTRAIGKAYRNKIGWIMKLAGYEPTPHEEVQKMGVIQTETGFEKAIARLKEAKTNKELETIWKFTLKAKERADDEVVAVKDEMKAKLQ